MTFMARISRHSGGKESFCVRIASLFFTDDIVSSSVGYVGMADRKQFVVFITICGNVPRICRDFKVFL